MTETVLTIIEVTVECPRCGADIVYAPVVIDGKTWMETVTGDCDCDLSEEEWDDLEQEAEERWEEHEHV